MNPQRHHLIYLYPDADFSINSLHADKVAIEKQVLGWLLQGLPCIYAKQSYGNTINLGLPLLHNNKKHRVALQVAPSAVQQQQVLPQLKQMQDFFLCCYGIEELDVFLDLQHVSDIAVYGSFLFHYLSGQPFVNENSDLDLLINYQRYSLTDLQEFIALLAKKMNRTIDGEIRFPKFGDVSIKELLDLSAKKLLCKSKDKPALLSRTELYEYYPLQ
ncbi:MAG: malonate decarboxylase holo-[acyl-carrier-protein] synthase [Legionella longbeachae]|nr:malonate decarboxylase holo-[acyl-carrier-protein] synthase [Legionella longbeachae]